MNNKTKQVIILLMITLFILSSCTQNGNNGNEDFSMKDVAFIQPEVHPDSVWVTDNGAVGDGEVDDTAAFKRAVALAKEKNVPIFIPGGIYRLTSTLILEEVDLYGFITGAWPADDDKLPTLFIDHMDSAGIHLKGGTISGVKIDYKQSQETYRKYPESILIDGSNSRVFNVKIDNPTTGIKVDGENISGLHLENIFMPSTHLVGVYLNGTTGNTVLNNIEMWTPTQIENSPFRNEGIGIYLGDNEKVEMNDCFTFNGAVGFYFDDKGESITDVSMVNCAADMIGVGILVKGSQNINVVGGTYWSHWNGIKVENSSNAKIEVNGGEFRANGSAAVDIRGGESTSISGSIIRRTMDNRNEPVIYVGAKSVKFDGVMVYANLKDTNFNAAVQWGASVSDLVFQNSIINSTGGKFFSGELRDVINNVTAYIE